MSNFKVAKYIVASTIVLLAVCVRVAHGLFDFFLWTSRFAVNNNPLIPFMEKRKKKRKRKRRSPQVKLIRLYMLKWVTRKNW